MPRKNHTPPRQRTALPEAPCAHKRRFVSDRQALEMAEYQMLLKPSLELGVYQCDYCGGWHLTNLAKK